ncbi:MAG: hypothetical protein CL608_04980 [Anaerolineaceae bacterium]|nr:hypothetical protein [Anaerolineaceae bacterium]
MPWVITAVLGLVFVFLLFVGQWRSTATGAQVQVPMFYDAHYLFPRPWTQAQEVPGVPAPFPVAFYGSNTISQTFISGADKLAAVEIWLQAPPVGDVTVTLSDETGPLFAGQIDDSPRAGGFVHFAFPTVSDAEGRTFELTLTALDATADAPAVTHVIGGDRLGGRLRLNEYPRPGNLELRTYVTGTAVFDALAEQLLPDIFRLRLQQYKPSFVKGSTFAGLLVLTAVLTVGLLVVARPPSQKAGQVGGWLLAGLLLVGLAWQLGDGRVYLPIFQETIFLEEATAVDRPIDTRNWLIVNDLTAVLWTAERLPEERFITTELFNERPAIRVPADSALEYALDLPLNGRLQTGLQATGVGSLWMAIEFNGSQVIEVPVTAGDPPKWLDLDLTPWQGQGGVLRLFTEPMEGTPDGLWLMPRLLAGRSWLLDELPETAVPAGHQLGQDIVLLGYSVEPAQPQPQEVVAVTLYWRGERPLSQNGTVFVHALNAAGEMVVQSDSQPVQNSYPLDTWPAGMIIVDRHQLVWPGDDPLSQLAVGLYDPTTLVRFPVQNPDGTIDGNGQALLPVPGAP